MVLPGGQARGFEETCTVALKVVLRTWAQSPYPKLNNTQVPRTENVLLLKLSYTLPLYIISSPSDLGAKFNKFCTEKYLN